MIGIKGLGQYLPANSIENQELLQRFSSLSSEFLENKLGIQTRCIADENEMSSDLAVKAIQQLLQQHPELDKKAIDLLILVTQNPDYKLPNTSAIVQNQLDLGHVCSFDINLGCSGFVYALAVAKSMMHTLKFKNAIVVTADTYSKIIDTQDKNTVTLFGDAGAATWLSADADNQLLDFDFGTDGSGFDNLIVPQDTNCLAMNGRKIFYFVMQKVPASIKKCLQKNNLSIDEIDYFVFHQANQYMLDHLTKHLKLSKEKVFCYFKNIGNTVSSSIPIALKQLQAVKDLRNKKVLVSGFGVGLSWATNIIAFEN